MNAITESKCNSVERRIADMTILYEVSRALQNTLEEEKVLYTILVGITHGRGLGFNRAFILLMDPAEKILQGRMAIGPSSPEEAFVIWQELRDKYRSLGEMLQQLPLTAVKMDLQVNRIVAQFQIPLSEHEHSLVRIMRSHTSGLAIGGFIRTHGLPADARVVELLGTSDFAAAPLFLADHDLGLLLADNAITRAPIEQESLHLLQIYAQAASNAIQNTRLYHQLTDRIAQSEAANRTLRESQQRLLHAERLSTIGRMAALLAHEIRTPLVSIGGFARKLLRTTEEGDPRREELKIIAEEVRRLELMIAEVLGYSKIVKLDLESTDINGLLHSVLANFDEALQDAGVQVVTELDPNLSPAMVDKFQVRQALINLIVNALDAMPSGGTLSITTISDRDYLEIGISDTGVGIAQEYWSKLFVPFFTTKTSGTGLGLAIVSQVIETHKGSLRFESTPGQGSTFYIRLALHPTIDPNETVAPADTKSQGLLS